MKKDEVRINWFGRCCFLLETGGKKVLFDPYDTYCKVDIGIIEADILLSSSSWHDHGHIGASPNAYICSYPGLYDISGIKIVGIEAKEGRGTPTVIFNLTFGPFSITNFADLGQEQDFSDKEKTILESTNIAFIRPNFHYELALKYCQPNIIFPEHYFPRYFIEKQVEENEKQSFLQPNNLVDEMMGISDYPLKEVAAYNFLIKTKDLSSRKLIRFLKVDPQVRYR